MDNFDDDNSKCASQDADNLEPVEMDMEESDEDLEKSCDDALDQANNNHEVASEIKSFEYQPRHANHEGNQHKYYDEHSSETKEVIRREDTGTKAGSKIIQVVNIAPTVTLDQLRTLFNFVGDIVNIELYHIDQGSENNFKVCFVEFAKTSSVLVAQYLTNTVFIDRALIVVPYQHNEIPPQEAAADSLTDPKLLSNFDCGVFSHLTAGVGGAQLIATVNPRLTALGLSQYPQLPMNTDPTRIEEIRRTVYIGNLDSTIAPDQVLKFFNDIGEVKYIRMAGDDTQPTRFAFVEFTHQSSVANALQHNGFLLGSRALKINHSNNAIVKPPPKIETDDISKKVRDRRSSSRDYGHRDRHQSSRDDRDYDRRRDRDRDRYYNHRRDSPVRRRSRDRDGSSRRRSRSRDYAPRRSRSRDKSTRRRSRSPREAKRRRSKSNERSKHHKRSRR